MHRKIFLIHTLFKLQHNIFHPSITASLVTWIFCVFDEKLIINELRPYIHDLEQQRRSRWTTYWTCYLGHKSRNRTVYDCSACIVMVAYNLIFFLQQPPTWNCVFAWLSFSCKCSTSRVVWCIVRCSINNLALILFWLSFSLLSNPANRSLSSSISLPSCLLCRVGSCRPSGLRGRRGIVLHKLSFSIKLRSLLV